MTKKASEMKKNIYTKPEIVVFKLKHRCTICAGSEINRVSGNANVKYRGGDNGSSAIEVRSRSSDWGFDEE